MKIFWFHSGLMPDACDAMGYEKRNTCGWLESLLEALLAADSTVEFCLLGFDPRPCDIQIGRVRHVSFETPFKTWYDTIPVSIENRARNLIAEYGPDLIHVHGTEYFYGNLSDKVYGGKPVVISLQGILSGCWPHYNGGLSLENFRGTNFNIGYLLKGRSVFSEKKEWAFKRATQERQIVHRHVNFIGRTEWDRNWLRYLNPGANYCEINENLRKEFYHVRRDPRFVKKHSIYCGAASSYPLKGVHWLLMAVAALKNEFPDIDLRIADANGLTVPRRIWSRLRDRSYDCYLRRLTKRLGLMGNVTALPSLTAREVAEELKNADVFVLPSLCENSPNSLCEAMLVGTPSISTFAGGIPSILKNGEEGRLVVPSDPAALAGAIRKWFLNPVEAEVCAEQARKTAMVRHDSAVNAQATLALYRNLVDSSRA